MTDEPDGLLPVLDGSITVRHLRQGMAVDRSGWRRLLPAGLISVSLHLFLLPLLLVITVTLADHLNEVSASRSNDDTVFPDDLILELDPDRDMDYPVEKERTVAAETEEAEATSETGRGGENVIPNFAQGIVVSVIGKTVTLKLSNGNHRDFQTDISTIVYSLAGPGIVHLEEFESITVGRFAIVFWSTIEGKDYAEMIRVRSAGQPLDGKGTPGPRTEPGPKPKDQPVPGQRGPAPAESRTFSMMARPSDGGVA